MFTKRIFGVGYVLAGLLPWYFVFQYTADRIVRSTRKDPSAPYDRKRGY